MMGIVACYDMHLYCDHPDCIKSRWDGADNYITAFDRKSAFREARRLGWTINEKSKETLSTLGRGKALCPKHSGKTT